MINRILERLEERRLEYEKASENPRFELPQKMYYKGVMRGYEYSKDVVQEVAKKYDWIPVSERLPEPFQRVLVYDAWDDSMTIEHLQENDSFIDSVVAWMPLPIAPYQKGE